MKQDRNEMELVFSAKSENEALARMAVTAFCMSLNPTMEEISDIKTAVSEAVTNAILHGYRQNPEELVRMHCLREDGHLTVQIRDDGVGMEDVARAMEPMYTSKPELERSGMGFSFMEAFMDELSVESAPGKGTTVTMKKHLMRPDRLTAQ